MSRRGASIAQICSVERARKAETENSGAAGDGEEGLLLGEEEEVLGFFL